MGGGGGGRNGGIIILILNLGARWKRVPNLTPRPLYPQRLSGTHYIGGGWAPEEVWTL